MKKSHFWSNLHVCRGASPDWVSPFEVCVGVGGDRDHIMLYTWAALFYGGRGSCGNGTVTVALLGEYYLEAHLSEGAVQLKVGSPPFIQWCRC